MSQLDSQLKAFGKRVKWLRAWHGLAIGAAVAGAICLALVVLDYLRVLVSEPALLLGLLLGGAVVGSIVSALRPVTTRDLADSIDRRATLKNRMGTAVEDEVTEMRELQREDAMSKLASLKPREVYPVRLSAWHGRAMVVCLLAAVVFLLGNTPLLDSAQKRAEKQEMKSAAKEIERVVKPMLERKPDETNADAKEIARKMDALRKDMERGRTPKEELMAKANKLAEAAQKTADQNRLEAQKAQSTAQQTLMKMAQAEALKDLQMTKEEFDESQLTEASNQTDQDRQDMADRIEQQMGQAKRQLGMSPRKADAKRNQSVEKRIDELQKELDELEQQLKSGKDAKGNELSAEQKERLKKLMEQLKELMKELKLSQKVQEFISKLTAMKEYREIQDMLRKAMQNGQVSFDENGKPKEVPELSDEEVEKLKAQMKEAIEKLEKMASEMSDADMKKLLEDYKKALEEALKNGLKMGMCSSLMPGFGFMPGFGAGLHSWGASGPGQDNFFENRGVIPLSEKGQDSNAKTIPMGTRGDRQDRGDETYVELKGPVKPGERSSISYFKVLPRYKKQAEAVLRKDQIPKEHQKRVRDYFDSLAKGGK